MDLTKIVFVGWSPMVSSLADGIKNKCPKCLIYCMDIPQEYVQQGIAGRYFDPAPIKKADLFEDADMVFICKEEDAYIETLKNIKSFLSPETYVIDIQMVKTELRHKAQLLIDESQIISTYVFLDYLPDPNLVRAEYFFGKIAAIICDGSVDTLQKMRDFWDLVGVKIVPTSADFFDEIIAQTKQTLTLVSSMYANILQSDDWSDTLFFGFYNKQLQSMLAMSTTQEMNPTNNIIRNMDNTRRMLSLLKKEIEQIDQWIDNEDHVRLNDYFEQARNFSKRI